VLRELVFAGVFFTLTRRSPILVRMSVAQLTFQFLRHVSLGTEETTGERGEILHTFRIAWKQLNRPIAKQTGSIRFLAHHCPRLMTFSFYVTFKPLSPFSVPSTELSYRPKSYESKALEPLVLALKQLVQNCPELFRTRLLRNLA
jgi:hypothetical protein